MKGERDIMNTHSAARTFVTIICIMVVCAFIAPPAHAATKGEIDASVKASMARFGKEIKGGNEYLKAAKGALVIPNVTKAALVVGGQYGQGALQIGGKTVRYYSITAGSLGWQIGGEQYDLVILFMTDDALNKFQKSEGWEAGVDAEVTLIQVGAELTVATLRSQHPIAGFVFDQKGLMAGVSIRGSKFTPIKPD